MAKILFINTGGTIDADKYPDPAHPPKFAAYTEKSLLKEFVTGGGLGQEVKYGLGQEVKYIEYSRRDSKNMKPEDIFNIGRLIIEEKADQVIITHGTDVMPKNARLLAGFLGAEKELNKRRIVMTGAMMPLHNGLMSDAYPNLDFIVKHIDEFEHGVHVVMHAKRFNIDGLSKNFYKMRMENQLQYTENDG